VSIFERIQTQFGFKRKWKVGRCCWPFPEGYATVFYLRGQRTIVDTGLTKEQAQEIVDRENRK
jgi:hypothetical protein